MPRNATLETADFQRRLLSSPIGTRLLAYAAIPPPYYGAYKQKSQQMVERLLCTCSFEIDHPSHSLFATKLDGPVIPSSKITPEAILTIQAEARKRKKMGQAPKPSSREEILSIVNSTKPFNTTPVVAPPNDDQDLITQTLAQQDAQHLVSQIYERILSGETVTYHLDDMSRGQLAVMLRNAGYSRSNNNLEILINPDGSRTTKLL